MALKLIKNKIKSTERTSKVTKAMEAVSAVKMRKSQERAILGRPYAQAALRILERVSRTNDAKQHPLFATHDAPKVAIIVVTSDKGLAGSLNSAVIKEAAAMIRPYSVDEVDLICFGKKSYEYFTRRLYQVPRHYLNVSDQVSIDDMEELVSFVTNQFLTRSYRSVHIVYQNYISTFEQSPVSRQILPLKNSAIKEIVTGIVSPVSSHETELDLNSLPPYTVEPNLSSLYQAIFPMLIKIMIYHALLESKASEHSARMVAMKNATDKAKEVTKLLTLKYNKERQSVITAEVSEITGGIEAMSNK